MKISDIEYCIIPYSQVVICPIPGNLEIIVHNTSTTFTQIIMKYNFKNRYLFHCIQGVNVVQMSFLMTVSK